MVSRKILRGLTTQKLTAQLIFLLVISVMLSTELTGQTIYGKRPKVGVVLSGGAAKGIAHIGALKVIEEAGIPIDYIAGTSMGAIIGGLYAIGYDAEALEKITVGQSWSKLFSDNIARTDLSLEEKSEEDIFFVSFPFSKSGVVVPSGIISGQNIENLLNTLCFPAYQTRNFEELPIPYCCVAMDIISGKEVVLRKGYLPEAMRASMAIPTLFEPVRHDSMLLVDGGVINNFPADRLKEMGADIIIGVDVGHQPSQPSKVYDIFRIFEQTVMLASESRVNANRKLCDILIRPELTGLGPSDFNKADSLIARGERAARSYFPDLLGLHDSLQQCEAFQYKRPVLPSTDSVFLKEIHILGLDKVSARLLSGKLQLHLLSWIKPEDLATAIDHAYSSLYFTKVTYELEPIDSDKTIREARLLIRVTEKEGGILRVGLNYNTYFNSSIIINATFRNMIFDGSKLSLNLGLGNNPKLLASYFKNNGAKPGFGIDLEGQNLDEYFYRGDHRITTIDFTDLSFRLYTQSIIRNSFSIGGGFEYEYVNLKPLVGDVLPEKESNRYYNGYFFMNLDRFDDVSYPSTGARFHAVYKLVNANNISSVHFFRLCYEKALPVAKRLTLIPSFFGGYSSADTTASVYQLYLGGMNQMVNKGLLPFVGLDFMQINNRVMAGAGFHVQYNFWRNNYVVLKAHAGKTAWMPTDLLSRDNGLLGFGITIGNNSIIGPIEITFMASNAHHDLLSYFNIGYWF
jgi:NTE family protein